MLAQNSTTERAMIDLNRITNPAVKAVIEAFQKGDRTGWLKAFEPDAKLTDDGEPRSFADFTNDALGHEWFTSLEEVEDGGLFIVGQFHSDQWGDFRTYFRFHPTADEKFGRLDIGQAE
jgi:hypothetical protein